MKINKEIYPKMREVTFSWTLEQANAGLETFLLHANKHELMKHYLPWAPVLLNPWDMAMWEICMKFQSEIKTEIDNNILNKLGKLNG
ncbi:MAG: hypothetical protein [Caudoviricetes sp.]|nr:MAG: hypothetical protein [Caudoviricetes sp.]